MDLIEYNKFSDIQLRNFTQRRILHVAVKWFNQYHICHLVQKSVLTVGKHGPQSTINSVTLS